MAKSNGKASRQLAPARRSDDATQPSTGESWLLRAFDRVYHFLASLKLAVLSISSLAAVLAYATFFETWHGTAAVQEKIYRSPWFALLLSFLGINILCAALIRYPWKRRQIGFLVTHAGLLVVLLGSWISFNVTDDGQVGMVEGDRSEELVRIDHPAVWVQEVSTAGETATRDGGVAYKLPLHGGSFPWESSVRLAQGKRPRTEVLTDGNQPFRLVVKDYHPASTPVRLEPQPAADGVPMAKVSLYITPPNSDQRVDILRQFDDGTESVRWWQASNPRFQRAGRDLGQVLATFQYASQPGMVEDFLALPDDPLTKDMLRLHYTDTAGKPRVYDWVGPLGEGQKTSLPDSEIQVTLEKLSTLPLDGAFDQGGEMQAATGETELHFAELLVRRGDGPEGKYIACSSLPSLPNKPGEANPLVQVVYYRPPVLSAAAMQGRSSVVDLLGTPDGKVYYRAFSRDGLRGKGEIEPGKNLELVTKSLAQPVTFTLRVDRYFPSAEASYACDAVELPANQKDSGIPAALVELTVGDQTRETWVRRMHPTHDFRHLFRPLFDFQDSNGDGRDDRDGHIPRYETIRFANGASYRLGLDFDRRPLGFSVQLTDFEVGMDPGTSQPSSYASDVLLNDEASGVDDRPIQISMNQPLTWKDHTFYQANFDRVRDPRGRETGQFISIFQVRYDPDWCWGTVYAGCGLVVLGTFLQFYMRSGVFRYRRREATEPVDRGGSPRGGELVGVGPAISRATTATDSALDEVL